LWTASRVGAITYLGIPCRRVSCICKVATPITFHRETSTRVSFRVNPWQGLPGVACSETRIRCWTFSLPHVQRFRKHFLMRHLRNDVGLVVRMTISTEQKTKTNIRRDGREASLQLGFWWNHLRSGMILSMRVSTVRITHSAPSSLASHRSSSLRPSIVRALSKPNT
jgi:hypothetical protein